VEDKATVPIYYESRLAKLELNEEEKPKVDAEFEEATEGEEVERRERLRTKWAALEAVAGTEKRLRLVAEDLIKHFEQRLDAMDGKAMIVCMRRRICVDLYNQLVKLRPNWNGEGDNSGALRVVMTGSAADGPEWQPMRNAVKPLRRSAVGTRRFETCWLRARTFQFCFLRRITTAVRLWSMLCCSGPRSSHPNIT
jgi:type I restriction enzyme R subunit